MRRRDFLEAGAAIGAAVLLRCGARAEDAPAPHRYDARLPGRRGRVFARVAGVSRASAPAAR